MIDIINPRYSTTVKHKNGETKITLTRYPGSLDWFEVKRRALITIGKKPVNPPDDIWIERMLDARHSPIRFAMYAFDFEDIPSNTSTHFCRHVHAQPYVSSLRPDRISEDIVKELTDGVISDPDRLPRCTPVGMILDVNAEELMIMANKRLCAAASEVTRSVMQAMCFIVNQATPVMDKFLVPMCEYCGGVCHEFSPCGRCVHY